MTEAEWLACESPVETVAALLERAGARKRMLFACACFRRGWALIQFESTKEVIVLMERYADGDASPSDFAEARAKAEKVKMWSPYGEAGHLQRAVADVASNAPYAWYAVASLQGKPRPAPLLHDLFGPPAPRPERLPVAVLSLLPPLAQAAYDERHLPSGHLDNARLAVLSDALEEAGCTDADILAHLRSPGPHVRGCWALDLILGKQ
jgi:hypothetical protein